MKRRVIFFVLAAVAALGLVLGGRTVRGAPDARGVDVVVGAGEESTKGGASGSGSTSTSTSTSTRDAGYPHAIRDPEKRDELRRRLLEAAMAAPAAEESAPAAERGKRGTEDVEEFGRFVAQAIREDFVPMARECAKDLGRKRPDAGGTARVAFELLGDRSIGGVVNEADVVADASTLHDDEFAACLRESLYGVYFDPPPAGGRATLRFDVNVAPGGTVDEQVDDFHPKDKR
jgi:hypothetical protein